MVFTAINTFGSSLRQPWPVVRTQNILNTKLAAGHNSEYVWLLDQEYEFDVDFPLAWLPIDEERDHIHTFPLISEATGRRIKDIAALVPVRDQGRRWPIKQNIPAKVDATSFDIFLVGDGTNDAIKQWKEKRGSTKNMYLVNDTGDKKDLYKQVLRQLHSNFAWLLPIDANIPESINLVNPTDGLAIYKYDFGKLYPASFFATLGEQHLSEIECQFDQQ